MLSFGISVMLFESIEPALLCTGKKKKKIWLQNISNRVFNTTVSAVEWIPYTSLTVLMVGEQNVA